MAQSPTSDHKKLTADGERMIPEFHKGSIIYGEHIGRYLSISSLVKGKLVLDIASGSGYGTKHISSNAKFVWGVDNNQQAVEYAKKTYGGRNIEYLLGDATEIPIESASVDCVISMETIEHISDQDKFLSEIKRVLKTDGVAVISTPNDRVYPKGNHFHVKEHDKISLNKLLSAHFSNVDLHYQVVSLAASIIEEPELVDSKDVELNGSSLQKTYAAQPDKSIYYLAVCGDKKLPKLLTNTILSEEFSHLERQKLHQQLHDSNRQADELRSNLQAEKDLNARLRSELNGIYNSKKWKAAVRAANIKTKLTRRKSP